MEIWIKNPKTAKFVLTDWLCYDIVYSALRCNIQNTSKEEIAYGRQTANGSSGEFISSKHTECK